MIVLTVWNEWNVNKVSCCKLQQLYETLNFVVAALRQPYKTLKFVVAALRQPYKTLKFVVAGLRQPIIN
jgi:hypothetical protein